MFRFGSARVGVGWWVGELMGEFCKLGGNYLLVVVRWLYGTEVAGLHGTEVVGLTFIILRRYRHLSIVKSKPIVLIP